MQQKIQVKSVHESVSEQQIGADLSSVMPQGTRYKHLLEHPMIAHLARRAHVYKICCEPIETSDMFNQYLANFDLDSKQGYAMNKLLTNWFVIMSSYLEVKPEIVLIVFVSKFLSKQRRWQSTMNAVQLTMT